MMKIKKLANITSQYSKFNTNQVLTEHQLNEFLNYFEDQGHLTRIGLSGVGIVCGFDVKRLEDKNIEITQGYGVTTDGDLLYLRNSDGTNTTIDLDSKVFDNFKIFNDDPANYTPFFYQGADQINLWELRATDDIGEETGFAPLTSLSGNQNMVVMLYLENYEKEPEECTELTCDNQGLVQVANLRVLLVSKEDAEYIISQDALYKKHDWYQTYFNLPEISAKRVVLTPENTETLNTLKAKYQQAIFANNSKTNLVAGFEALNSKFGFNSISLEINSLFSFPETGIPYDFQYRYDVFKDLIDTYNEIKELLLHINVECTPDTGSFPKHLLLGRVVEPEIYKTCRHQFYKSPIIGHEDANYQKVLLLLQRAKEIADNYMTSGKGTEIRITPSQAHSPLGDKAVPFYYNVADGLLKPWSFEKYKNFKYKNNLSYYKENLSLAPIIQQPLLYNMDHNNFYRIEGVQGQNYSSALATVLHQKKLYGLNFDVKMLSINTSIESINLADYKCEFEDMGVLLEAWKKEQQCLLGVAANYISGFNLTVPGANSQAQDYTHKSSNNSSAATKSAAGGGGDVCYAEDNPAHQNDNNVYRSLTTDENTIGSYMITAIDNNPLGSVADIIAATTLLVTAAIGSEADWENVDGENLVDLRTFILTDAISLLSHAFLLSEVTPESLTQINTTSITAYENALKGLCDLVKTVKIHVKTLDFTGTTKDVIDLLLGSLTTVCCSGEKLKTLLAEIEERKTNILVQLQLSKYVIKHPGMEHLAGVEHGGTFIMVYLQNDSSSEPVYSTVQITIPFNVQPPAGSTGIIQYGLIPRAAQFVFVDATNIGDVSQNMAVIIGATIEATMLNLAKFLNGKWGAGSPYFAQVVNGELIITVDNQQVILEENFIQFNESVITGSNDPIYFSENEVRPDNTTPANTVVADFALPYLCCSDCASINFVIANEPSFLNLETDHICFDLDTPIYEFIMSPSDGIVSFVGDETLDSGLTQDDADRYVFDASLTDPSLYGQDLIFSLNGSGTICKVVVYKKVDYIVTNNSNDTTYNNDHSIATVKFTFDPNSFIPGLSYRWDVGNGRINTSKPDAQGEVYIEVNLLNIDGDSYQPTLTITNGQCSSEIALPLLEFEPKPDTCENQTLLLVEHDFEDLNAINIAKSLETELLQPSIQEYEAVLHSSAGYFNGNSNTIFIPKLILLMNKTATALIDPHNDANRAKISKIFILQTKLYYNVLRCQSDGSLIKDQNLIQENTRKLVEFLHAIRNAGIIFDNAQNGNLTAFLNEYVASQGAMAFVTDNITNKVLPEILTK